MLSGIVWMSMASMSKYTDGFWLVDVWTKLRSTRKNRYPINTPRTMPRDLYIFNALGMISSASNPTKNPPHRSDNPAVEFWNSLDTSQAIPPPKLTLKKRNPPSMIALTFLTPPNLILKNPL